MGHQLGEFICSGLTPRTKTCLSLALWPCPPAVWPSSASQTQAASVLHHPPASEHQKTKPWVLAPALASCVMLGKSPHLSDPKLALL